MFNFKFLPKIQYTVTIFLACGDFALEMHPKNFRLRRKKGSGYSFKFLALKNKKAAVIYLQKPLRFGRQRLMRGGGYLQLPGNVSILPKKVINDPGDSCAANL